jgi:diguanylate cyclase (GGDEF)-like protein
MDRRSRIAQLEAQVEILTQKLHAAEEENHSLLTDPLTLLPGRAAFEIHMDRFEAAMRRGNTSFAYLVLDLDGLKEINDTEGHLAGDELLSSMGHSIREHLRPSDYAFRVGGDEFVVILECEINDEMIFAAHSFLSRLRNLRDVGFCPAFSAGCAHVPVDFDSEERSWKDIYEIADAAMYMNKYPIED